jgi:hypothetical protein
VLVLDPSNAGPALGEVVFSSVQPARSAADANTAATRFRLIGGLDLWWTAAITTVAPGRDADQIDREFEGEPDWASVFPGRHVFRRIVWHW